MLEYLIKVSFVIAIALLFYKIFLQQESFFGTNRIYFVFCIFLAFICPYVEIPQLVNHQGYISQIFKSSEKEEVSSRTNYVPIYPESDIITNEQSPTVKTLPVEGEENIKADLLVKNSKGYSLIFWISLIYFFGASVFLLNLLFQLAIIYIKVLKSKDKIYDGSVVIVNTSTRQAPCSFFKYIFIHPDDYDFDTYDQIIKHEKIHVQQRHSWDLIFAELAVIILWFNPLIWLYKKEVEKNIEFQTDAILIDKKRVSKDKYQMNLLQIAVPEKPLNITTNYNQSLLKQRIMMMNAKKSNFNSYWKYAFIAPVFLVTILLLNEPVKSQDVMVQDVIVNGNITVNEDVLVNKEVSVTNEISVPLEVPVSQDVLINLSVPVSPVPVTKPFPKEKSINQLLDQSGEDMSKGVWYSHHNENEYCIEFKGIRNDGRWNITQCFNKNQFEKQGDDVFVMTRETGTLKLFGALDKEVSQGKYEFVKDIAFEQYLSKQNIENTDQNFLFHLHLHNVDKRYVEFLKGKFKNLNGNQLLALAIHNVDQNYIDGIASAGFKDLNADQVISARIHGVNPSSIKEFQTLGFGNLSMEKIVELKIHGIDADYIEGLKNAGFKDLPINQVVAAKIHGVDPSAIKEIQAMGFGDIGLKKMVELKIHNIDEAYIQDLKSAGFQDLSIDQIIEAKVHGLDPKTIKEIESLGFKDLNLRKIIELKIHGVNAAYIQDLKSLGFNNLSLDKVLQAKIHGVNPAAVKEIQALGFKDMSLDKIINAKIHGVNAAYIEDLKAHGFSNFTIDQAIEAKIHGVNGKFIKDAQSRGYNLKTLEEYIRVKIHGLARNEGVD